MAIDHIGLYLQGLFVVFAWLEFRHWATLFRGRRQATLAHAPATAKPVAADQSSLLGGLTPYLVFVLLLLVARPVTGAWPNGLAFAAFTIAAGSVAARFLSIPSPANVVVELAAYAILVSHGVTIQFAHAPTGGFLYFTAGAPIITCLWLFAFSRVLRLATVLPGLFEGLLALLSYLFMGSLYLQRQASSGSYAVMLLFAGVTTGLWVYTFRAKPSRIGPVAASCWAMTAGVLSIVGTSKRLAFLSIVPPMLVLLAPVSFFTYLIVSSYIMPKLDRGLAGRAAYRWNLTQERVVTVLLLFCLLGNMVALVSYLTADLALLICPGVFAAVLLWRMVGFLFKAERFESRPHVSSDTIEIMGVKIWARDEADLIDRFSQRIRNGERHIVVTPDSLALYRSLEDPAYRAVLERAAVCVPDGAGVVWAGDFLYEAPILCRIPGVELVERLLSLARDRGFSVYFLGTSPSVIARARDRMLEKYPGLQIVGARDGFFGPADEDAVVAEIDRVKPDMIFVGLGVPKQELFIARNIDRIRTSLMMGVGGTFDVISGEKDRAPVRFQQLGLEWLWRVILEPHRVSRIASLPFFVFEILKEKIRGSSAA